jgi:alkylhydroperoxidase family enzyme
VNPRITPVSEPYQPATIGLLHKMTPPGSPTLALFTTLARNIALADAVHGLGSYQLSRKLSLSLRDREIVINRTCVRCGCEYQWGVHVTHFAARAELTVEQTRSLPVGASSDPCWTSERDRVLIDVVDALCFGHDVDEALWARASTELDAPQLLDAMVLCGWYHAVCFVATATRLEPEPGAARFAAFLQGDPV